MLGVIPWFAPGGPWLRFGSMAARAAGLGPIASIALREGVAGGLHGIARSVVEQAKEEGKVDVGRTLSEGAQVAVLGAIGGRLLLPRQAAGEMAGHIARRIQQHAKLFADSPAAQAGTLNPVEEAVNTVARELSELAQSVRAQKTTTSQEIRNKFIELLGIDPYKSWYFASPENAVQFLEKMASEGVKAIPRAIVPRQHAAFLRRPQYAEQVAEVLTKAKEAPPAAVQQAVTKATPTTPTTVEDLLARLTSRPQEAAQKTPTSSKRPTKAAQRDIEKLIRALTAEGKTAGRRATKAATPTPQPEQVTASATEQASPTQAPVETLIKALTGTATQESPATGATVQATPKRAARKAATAAQKPAAQPQQAAETPAELAPLVRELFKAEETPTPPPQAGRPKQSKTPTKPTPTKPAEPVIAKETAVTAPKPAPQKRESTVYFDKSRGNLRLMVEGAESEKEVVEKGVDFLREKLPKGSTTRFRRKDGSIVEATVQEIKPNGNIRLKIGKETIETPVVRASELKGGKLIATIDARLVDIVDPYREAVRRTAHERVHLRNSMLVNRIGDNTVDNDGTITGLAAGQKVYFKRGGAERLEPGIVTQIAVEKVRRRSKHPRISVWVRSLDEKENPIGEAIKMEFDPLTFSIQEAADPERSKGMPLILHPDFTLWRPPVIKTEFKIARRPAKGGTQGGAKDKTRRNPSK
jgi:hypothetical protein